MGSKISVLVLIFAASMIMYVPVSHALGPAASERPGTLIVKIVVVDTLHSPFPAADFAIHINGNNPSPTDFPGSAAGITVFLDPGPYAVTETVAIPDYYGVYYHSYSQDCAGRINDGESKECIVTNTRQ